MVRLQWRKTNLILKRKRIEPIERIGNMKEVEIMKEKRIAAVVTKGTMIDGAEIRTGIVEMIETNEEEAVVEIETRGEETIVVNVKGGEGMIVVREGAVVAAGIGINADEVGVGTKISDAEAQARRR